MCLKGVAASAIKSLNFFLLDYRIKINMEFLSYGERCISHIISVLVLRGKQENPFSSGMGNCAGGIFLLSDANLTRSDFEHLNLFQS